MNTIRKIRNPFFKNMMAGVLLVSSVTATAADIVVDKAWSRALPPVSTVGAIYMTVRNTGAVERRLLKVYQDIAQRAELHMHLLDAGMMRMREQASVVVPAGTETEFAPGKLHVMLFDKRVVPRVLGRAPVHVFGACQLDLLRCFRTPVVRQHDGPLTLVLIVFSGLSMKNRPH